jgi:hypothetical protein
MLIALINTPKGKSPGTDCLSYEYYKEIPKEAAMALTGISNQSTRQKDGMFYTSMHPN